MYYWCEDHDVDSHCRAQQLVQIFSPRAKKNSQCVIQIWTKKSGQDGDVPGPLPKSWITPKVKEVHGCASGEPPTH